MNNLHFVASETEISLGRIQEKERREAEMKRERREGKALEERMRRATMRRAKRFTARAC